MVKYITLIFSVGNRLGFIPFIDLLVASEFAIIPCVKPIAELTVNYQQLPGDAIDRSELIFNLSVNVT